MTTWVALLRGVNVNGITVRSAELRDLFVALGFDAVRTVLASGNVRFEAAGATDRRAELTATIEQGLRDRFGYDAWILLVTVDELADAAVGCPFDDTDETRHAYLVFCRDEDVRGRLLEAARDLDPAIDPVVEGPGVVYWSVAKGSSTDTPFAKVLARAVYKSSTTTRNLRTVRKILD